MIDVFGSIGRGYTGEERSIVEFPIADLKNLQKWIKSVELQIRVLEKDAGGYGITGITPDALSVYGYIGNGTPDFLGYNAGIHLETITTTNMQKHEIYRFDVTNFLKTLTIDRHHYAGFTIRSETLGFAYIREGGADESQIGYPKLIINAVPEPNMLGTTAIMSILALRFASGKKSLIRRTSSLPGMRFLRKK
jgi:hypothetical protein